MDENMITLGGLLKVLESTKPITVNLFDQDNLLLILLLKKDIKHLKMYLNLT